MEQLRKVVAEVLTGLPVERCADLVAARLAAMSPQDPLQDRQDRLQDGRVESPNMDTRWLSGQASRGASAARE